MRALQIRTGTTQSAVAYRETRRKSTHRQRRVRWTETGGRMGGIPSGAIPGGGIPGGGGRERETGTRRERDRERTREETRAAQGHTGWPGEHTRAGHGKE